MIRTTAPVLDLRPGRCALLAVDVQSAFAHEVGPAAEAAVDRLLLLLEAARASGVAVAFARVVTRPETDPANLLALLAHQGAPADAAAVCRAGAPDAAFHRVSPAPGEIVVEKRRYSAFGETGLAAALRARGRDTVVVAGLTTDCCVDCTVRDAFALDFHVVLAADATADVTPARHAAAVAVLGRHHAVVLETADLRRAWGIA